MSDIFSRISERLTVVAERVSVPERDWLTASRAERESGNEGERRSTAAPGSDRGPPAARAAAALEPSRDRNDASRGPIIERDAGPADRPSTSPAIGSDQIDTRHFDPVSGRLLNHTPSTASTRPNGSAVTQAGMPESGRSAGSPEAASNRATRSQADPVPLHVSRPSAPVAAPTSDGLGSLIEQALAAGEPAQATRALAMARRSAHPEEARALLDRAGPALAMILQEAVAALGETPGARSTPSSSLLAIADVCAVVEHATQPSARGAPTVRDLAAAIVPVGGQNDTVVFAAVGQAVAAGAGTRLAFALLRHLDERHGKRRASPFHILLGKGLRRLAERLDRAYGTVSRQIGPLIFEWSERAANERTPDALLELLRAQGREFLQALETDLDRVDRVGLEMFRAMVALADASAGALALVRHEFLASRGILEAVALSRSACLDIDRLAGPAAAPTVEAVCVVLTEVGFEADPARWLADRVCTVRQMPMDAGWAQLDDFGAMQRHGRAFQTLLAHLNGRFMVLPQLEPVSFADLEARWSSPRR